MYISNVPLLYCFYHPVCFFVNLFVRFSMLLPVQIIKFYHCCTEEYYQNILETIACQFIFNVPTLHLLCCAYIKMFKMYRG